MRSSFSIVLSVVVLAAFIEAPYFHTHRHESTQRHPGPFLHFHVRSAHQGGKAPEFRGFDPNEDAQYENWFCGTPSESGLIAVAIPEEPFVLPAPQESGRSVEVPLRSGHDPPPSSPKNPRAPPA